MTNVKNTYYIHNYCFYTFLNFSILMHKKVEGAPPLHLLMLTWKSQLIYRKILKVQFW